MVKLAVYPRANRRDHNIYTSPWLLDFISMNVACTKFSHVNTRDLITDVSIGSCIWCTKALWELPS